MEAYKICPQCGTHNDPQSGLCTKCQKTLVDVPVSGDLSKVKPGKNPVAQVLKVCAVVIYLFAAVTGLIEASNSGGICMFCCGTVRSASWQERCCWALPRSSACCTRSIRKNKIKRTAPLGGSFCVWKSAP